MGSELYKVLVLLIFAVDDHTYSCRWAVSSLYTDSSERPDLARYKSDQSLPLALVRAITLRNTLD